MIGKKYAWFTEDDRTVDMKLWHLGKFDADNDFGIKSAFFDSQEAAEKARVRLLNHVLRFGHMIEGMGKFNTAETPEKRQSLHDRIVAGSFLVEMTRL